MLKTIFSMDGKVYRSLNLATELLELNLLVLLSSLPLITIGASLTTMYAVVLKLQTHTCGPIWATYWQTFRQEWRRGTLLGLMYGGVLAALVILGRMLAPMVHTNLLVMLPLLVVVGLWLLMGTYLFALQARYTMSFGQLFKSAAVLAVQNAPVSILMFGLAVVVMVYVPVFLLRLWLLWGLFGVSVTGYLQGKLLQRVFGKYADA